MTPQKNTRQYVRNALCRCCREPRANRQEIRPRISFLAGYGSCFGDENFVEGEFCLRCLIERIGHHFHLFVPEALRDPKCGRCSMPIDLDYVGYQEAITFRFPLPDEDSQKLGPIIESVICQHCAKQRFGKFLQIRWEPPFLGNCPKSQPLWAWQSYQLEQGWKDAQLLLCS